MESATNTLPAQELPLNDRAPQLAPYRFTTSNAREMAHKSQEARRQRELTERLAAERIAAQQAREQALSETQPNRERLELVGKLILRAQEELENAMEPRERAALMVALDRLLDRERVLMGIPMPGSRRPGRDKPSRERPPAEPIE